MDNESTSWKPGVVDEFHGMGGTYRLVDGKRVLVPESRTDLNPKVEINDKTGERTLAKTDETAKE